MDRLKNKFLVTLLAALLQIGSVHNSCSADVEFELQNNFSLTTLSQTTQNLDHCNYNNTQVTSGWVSNEDVVSYNIIPELIWTIKPINTYVKLNGSYGWILSGTNIEYPFRWDIDGNSKGCELEVGYIWDLGGFSFLPCIGFEYSNYHSTIRNQRLFHSTNGSFISQNGTKSNSSFYIPYIGFEVDFKTKFLNKYDLQWSFNYNIGYGWGTGRNTVHPTVITILPSTSRFGSTLTYEDLINHYFEYAVSYSATKHLTISLEFDFNTIYNTHALPLKFDHNDEIVAAGQFTDSQYHVVSDYESHTYSVMLSFVYNFGGNEGTFISH